MHVRMADSGEIVALFAKPQPDALDDDGTVICAGVPTVDLPDDAPEIVAFLASQQAQQP